MTIQTQNGLNTPAVGRATTDAGAVMEQVMLVGDLSRLTAQQRVSYYMKVCESLGLNPATKPFDYISLQGKLTLYARRDATDQLRKRDKVSITITAREKVDDVYVVTARATTPDGRTDEAIGAVPLANLKGEALANAFMKAETKAKRRVTLSVCGLGFADESEIDSIASARRVNVNDQGEIVEVQPVPISTVRVTEALQRKQEPQHSGKTQDAASGVLIGFGKHRGKTLTQVHAEDPGYVQWLASNATDPTVKRAARELANAPTADATTDGMPDDAPPPEAYMGDEQETFGDQSAPLW